MTSKEEKIKKIIQLKQDLITGGFNELDNAETDFFNQEEVLLTINHKGLDMYSQMLKECKKQMDEYGHYR